MPYPIKFDDRLLMGVVGCCDGTGLISSAGAGVVGWCDGAG